MSWLHNVLAGDSQIKHEIQELAERGQDKTLTPKKRLEAMFELGAVVEAGEQLQTMLDEHEEATDAEPKYVWRNGAKVKVK